MSSSKTVSVACKLPHGLHLQLHKVADVPGGQPSQPVGPRVTLNGGNHPEAIAGWGLTENVNEEFIHSWLEANKELELVKQGLIIVRSKTADVVAEAKEKKEKKHGLEALDPKKPPKGIEKLNDK